MKQTRQTFNVFLEGLVAGLAGFNFYTGDEKNKRRDPPYVSVEWIDTDGPGLKPESRSTMCNIQIWTINSSSSKLDDACISILQGLGLYEGSKPIATIPKKNFASGRPGVDTGTQLILDKLLGKGWTNIQPPDTETRIKGITIVVDYVPG